MYGGLILQTKLIPVKNYVNFFYLITLVSYGVMDLPRTKGFHKLTCNTWTPMGDLNSANLSFFLQTFPRLKARDVISQNLDKREFLNTTSSGKVVVELEVRCFKRFNLR